jgi:hypothetical protein
VTRLREQARALRESRDIPGRAACYNQRALAYRPDDTELIAAASTLSRSAKTRRIAERALGTFVGIAAVAGVVVALARFSQRQAAPPTEVKKPSASAAVPMANSAVAKDKASAEAVVQGPAPSVRRAPRSIPRQAPETAPSAADGVGRVRVVLAGPASATVRIDGAEVPWFGKVHELTPGEHSFEFVAPNEQCCERGKTIRVRVPVSEGPDDVHVVQGRIEFRPATLDLRGPPGSSASCGPLGEFPVPQPAPDPHDLGGEGGQLQAPSTPGQYRTAERV